MKILKLTVSGTLFVQDQKPKLLENVSIFIDKALIKPIKTDTDWYNFNTVQNARKLIKYSAQKQTANEKKKLQSLVHGFIISSVNKSWKVTQGLSLSSTVSIGCH